MNDFGIPRIATFDSPIDPRLILQDFGEISSSWYLESKEGAVVLKLRQAEQLFERSTGIDLVGLMNGSWRLVYAESKTRADRIDVPSSVCCSNESLTGQLSAGRINRRLFNRFAIQGSRLSIALLASELIESGVLPNDQQIIESIISATTYDRFGFAVHSAPNFGASLFSNAITQCGTGTTFIDIAFDDMPKEIADFLTQCTV